MKNIFKFLVLTVSLSVVVSMEDYCEMEKRVCGGQKHIGCDNSLSHEYSSIHLVTLTAELKELILDRINSFRSLIATGKQIPYESASNMRLVTWNNEMEFFAGRLLKEIDLDEYCYKTDEHPNSSKSLDNSRFNKKSPPTLTAFLTSIFDQNFKMAVKTGTASTHSRYKHFNHGFFSANLTSIGCAINSPYHYSYDENSMKLECVLNEPEETSLKNGYQHGEACSNCSSYNQVCSVRFPGLCEDVKVLPVGAGAKGRP